MEEPLSPLLAAEHRQDDLHLLREVVRTQQTLMAVFAREVGMPVSRLALMRELALAAPRSPGVMELARQLGINAAAITRQVQEMERAGLVQRRPDPRDHRRQGLQLSRKGRQTFLRLHRRSHDLERSLQSRLSAEEVQTAVKVLATLRTVLEERR